MAGSAMLGHVMSAELFPSGQALHGEPQAQGARLGGGSSSLPTGTPPGRGAVAPPDGGSPPDTGQGSLLPSTGEYGSYTTAHPIPSSWTGRPGDPGDLLQPEPQGQGLHLHPQDCGAEALHKTPAGLRLAPTEPASSRLNIFSQDWSLIPALSWSRSAEPGLLYIGSYFLHVSLEFCVSCIWHYVHWPWI